MHIEIQELKILYYEMLHAKPVTGAQLDRMKLLIENLQMNGDKLTDRHIAAVVGAQKEILDACNKVRN